MMMMMPISRINAADLRLLVLVIKNKLCGRPPQYDPAPAI